MSNFPELSKYIQERLNWCRDNGFWGRKMLLEREGFNTVIKKGDYIINMRKGQPQPQIAHCFYDLFGGIAEVCALDSNGYSTSTP